MSKRKINVAVTASFRDQLMADTTALLATDTDADRAWTVEQALASYKRLRVRLLGYGEERKRPEAPKE